MIEADLNAASTSTVLANAELQDHLLAVTNDLARLQGLLTDACDTLIEGFLGVTTQLQSLQVVKPANSAAIERAVVHLGKTAKALQFQDMSTQLIAHASQRLRHCCDRLAQDVFADDEDGDAVIEPAPLRPNPVTQSEVDTGFVELF
jgi:nitrogen fixation/metabolism regulation signal transduction histidine kinase